MADIFEQIQSGLFPALFNGVITDNQFILDKNSVSIFNLESGGDSGLSTSTPMASEGDA